MSEGRHYVSRFFSVLVSDVALASSRHRSRQDGGAGNPKPELDLPCAEGRPDDKNALEDRVSRPVGPLGGDPQRARLVGAFENVERKTEISKGPPPGQTLKDCSADHGRGRSWKSEQIAVTAARSVAPHFQEEYSSGLWCGLKTELGRLLTQP
ncbi:MAG: hypothetical protein ABSF71_19965 [Terriglobia bacterium]|jgi:hypothetical protein